MPRPIEALIHTGALSHNLARLRRIAPDARIFAVVKANAYGHGIERVFEALRGADAFALLDLIEAQRVRDLGWRGPILLLEGCFEPRDLEHCSRLDLWHTVHHTAQIDWLAAHKTHAAQHIFLKLNSGMNRLGFAPAAYASAWQRLAALTQVERITLMTHFANADAAGAEAIAGALAVFESTVADLPGDRTLCNSAATLCHAPGRPEVSGDWLRPGIALYGSSPDFPTHSAADWDLHPAMTLRAQLIAVQSLAAGDGVGYGSRFRAQAPMRIGVAACGYADGYPRSAPTGTPVLVDGARTHLVGCVSMDMVTVDLDPVPQARVGSEVTLWGRGPQGSLLSIDEVAHAAGTLGYELMCGLAARVPVRDGA